MKKAEKARMIDRKSNLNYSSNISKSKMFYRHLNKNRCFRQTGEIPVQVDALL